MIGIDANILLRYITRDDGQLSDRAAAVLEQQCSADSPGYVTVLALAEVFWTLRSSYKYSRAELAEIIETLLNARELVFEHADAIWYALEQHRSGKGFADALIGRIAAAAGCDTTLTLDTQAAKLKDFTIA